VCVCVCEGDRGGTEVMLRYCATNRKVACSTPAGVIGIFIDIKSFRSHYGPGVDSAPNRSISRSKGGRCVRLITLPPSCVVMKAGNLNFLEPSGSLQACNGTALPIYICKQKRKNISAMLFLLIRHFYTK